MLSYFLPSGKLVVWGALTLASVAFVLFLEWNLHKWTPEGAIYITVYSNSLRRFWGIYD